MLSYIFLFYFILFSFFLFKILKRLVLISAGPIILQDPGHSVFLLLVSCKTTLWGFLTAAYRHQNVLESLLFYGVTCRFQVSLSKGPEEPTTGEIQTIFKTLHMQFYFLLRCFTAKLGSWEYLPHISDQSSILVAQRILVKMRDISYTTIRKLSNIMETCT